MDMTGPAMCAQRLCSPQCLLSVGTEAKACGCCCAGRWHGALADTRVPGSATARIPGPPPQAGPHLLDLLATVGAR